ncbi:MAG: glutamate--tRNA ligase [Holosporales bacterium]|nr:glutamate--tRNA ligase [Holosporales bacterium]
MSIVVRFAPSPTGVLHIGSVRTALFNWLFARHNDGKFLLRIEDTDKLRSNVENTRRIYEILQWLQIDWDDEPVIQSSRIERHKQAAFDLVEKGMAYYCDCSAEELTAKKEEAIKLGKSYKYDRVCRNRKLTAGAIRLKSEITGKTEINDMVQGNVIVDNTQLDDLVLLRSDETPTYMLSVVVDDHDMGITHVIRGDDHLTNTFRQIQIYKACGWSVPRFAHIPLIYGADGTKLSKRNGAASAQDYMELGYLPEAICNYLLRLGWSHGDDEVISRAQAVEWFSFESVGKSPSRFDMTKLQNLNSYYLKNMDNKVLLNLLEPFFKVPPNSIQKSQILSGMNSLKERAKTLVDLASAAGIYIKSPEEYDEQCLKYATQQHISFLHAVIIIIKEAEIFESEPLLDRVKILAQNEGVKLTEIAQALRSALCGKLISPSVFEIMSILGKDESICRIFKYINHYQKH